MLITIVFDIKFLASQSRKCCLDKFDFLDITRLIWHPCTDNAFKNWTYVQFKTTDEIRIESSYDKVDKLDRLSKDFGKIIVPFEVRFQSKAKVYD